jgi:hypothetical protein
VLKDLNLTIQSCNRYPWRRSTLLMANLVRYRRRGRQSLERIERFSIKNLVLDTIFKFDSAFVISNGGKDGNRCFILVLSVARCPLVHTALGGS